MSTAIVPPYFFVFDVESVGLHGGAFAFGGVVATREGETLEECAAQCDPADVEGTDEGRQWIAENVPDFGERFPMVANPYEFRRLFWDIWNRYKGQYPGIVMVADCAWPVEARFLIDCVNDDPENRTWEGPYPLHDLASVYMAQGIDPLETNERLEDELPAHNPLCDARQSARLLCEAMEGVFTKAEKASFRESKELKEARAFLEGDRWEDAVPSVLPASPESVGVGITRDSDGGTTIHFEHPVQSLRMPSEEAEQFGMRIAREARGSQKQGRSRRVAK